MQQKQEDTHKSYLHQPINLTRGGGVQQRDLGSALLGNKRSVKSNGNKIICANNLSHQHGYLGGERVSSYSLTRTGNRLANSTAGDLDSRDVLGVQKYRLCEYNRDRVSHLVLVVTGLRLQHATEVRLTGVN